jgi:PTH1 family peptidyl-tRNA hydrolase
LQGALRTPEFLRVRIGVGRPPGRRDPADFVLEPFPKRDEDEAAALVQDAADAVMSVISSGLDLAQDRYNRSGPRA